MQFTRNCCSPQKVYAIMHHLTVVNLNIQYSGELM